MSEQIENSRLQESPYNTCYILLDYADRQVLYERIDRRVEQMLENGLIDEARRFSHSEGLKTSGNAIGYKELSPYFLGKASFDSCVDSLKRATRRYAKRQISWFKRREGAVKLAPDSFVSFEELVRAAEQTVRTFLQKEE